MKIILSIIAVFLFSWSAHAYIEDSRQGETQLTSGEQNSALYHLQGKSIYKLKELKKADAYIAKAKSSGKTINATDFDDLLSSEQEYNKKQELKRIEIETQMRTRSPQMLITSVDSNVYESIQNISNAQIKDIRAVHVLQQKLAKGDSK